MILIYFSYIISIVTKVSKKYISKERIDRIYKLLFNLLIKINNKEQAKQILSELLTSTEQLMIAKRIACYYLISSNLTIAEISDILKLSTSTVFYFRINYKNNKLLRELLANFIFKDKLKKSINDLFIEFYYNNPRKGSDWSYNKKTYNQYKNDTEKPI